MIFDPHPNLLLITITDTPATPTTQVTLKISNADRTILLAAIADPTATPLNGSLGPATGKTPANTEIVRLTAVGAADSGGAGKATITITRNAETGGQTGHSVAANDTLEFTITAKPFTDIEAPILTLSNFVVSGLTIPTSAGLSSTSVLGVIWYGGQKIAVASDGGHTYTASKDTYVDISNAGVYTYIPVTIGNAAPALTANSIRIAKVVTNGSAVTSVIQTGVDSLGNVIYPIHSVQLLRGYPVNPTPTANNIPVLDANALLPSSLLLKSKCIYATRDLTAASGDVAYTGVGFQPTAIWFFGNIDGSNRPSFGMVSSDKTMKNMMISSDSNWYGNELNALVVSHPSASDEQGGVVKSFDADGFTLTWTKINSPTGTLKMNFLCFR